MKLTRFRIGRRPARRLTVRALATSGALLASWPTVAAAAPLGAYSWHIEIQRVFLGLTIALIVTYILRHYVFTLNRLFARQRHPYLDVDAAPWPSVTVMVPAHDEEMVLPRILDALLRVDYPEDRLSVLVVDDRSTDRTPLLLDVYAAEHPQRIRAFHRREGAAGKAAALKDAMEFVTTDVVLVFDADYLPGRGLIKQLVAPFFDPEVGAVMGRVVPLNAGRNLLTRMLDLERAGGYQVDQQARMNLDLVPQYGGTVGGVRRSALDAVGGWNVKSLAEDTDATFRLLLGGWKTVYQNRSECYEEVPETWKQRVGQLVRWARGHNQALLRYIGPLLRSRKVPWRTKVDGALLLGVYALSPLLVLAWAAALSLWHLGINESGTLVVLAVASYLALGNFATFFEVAAATHLDRTPRRARLLPFLSAGFLVAALEVTRGAFVQLAAASPHRRGFWHKTERRGDA